MSKLLNPRLPVLETVLPAAGGRSMSRERSIGMDPSGEKLSIVRELTKLEKRHGQNPLRCRRMVTIYEHSSGRSKIKARYRITSAIARVLWDEGT
jgi:hypothetical protein